MPKYLLRPPGRPAPERPARARSKLRERVFETHAPAVVGTPEQYGLPKPDHRFGEAHPTISGRILDRLAARRDHAEAEHRAPRRRRGRVRRRHARARRRRRLLHGLQDQLPVLRRGVHLRARQPHRAVPARLPPRHRRRLLRRARSSRSARSCRSPSAGRSGSPTYLRGEYLLPARAEMLRRHPRRGATAMRRATWPPSATRSRSTSTTTCAISSASARPGAERARAAGFALPIPPRAAAARPARTRPAARVGDRRRAAGKRERTKAANRAAILDAAREVFADIGYGAASVRDIVRRTDLASGTFYNYFPDKESVFRALVDEIAGGARARVRAARARRRRRSRRSSPTASAPTSPSSPRTRRRFELMRRNAGTIRTLFDEPALGARDRRAARGPRRRRSPPARCRRTTPGSWRRRWSARPSRSASDGRPRADRRRRLGRVRHLRLRGRVRAHAVGKGADGGETSGQLACSRLMRTRPLPAHP